DADQLGDPADAGNHRLVPFLEIDLRPAPQRGRFALDRREARLQAFSVGIRLVASPDECAEAADVVEDPVDAAMVADPHLDAVPNQFGGDVGLDVGKTHNEVRLQLQDLADLRRGEGADLRLLPACDRRAHGEAADADDAMLLAQRVQHFRGLLGEADDALRSHAHCSKPVTDTASASPIRPRGCARRASARAGGNRRRTRTRSSPASPAGRPSAAAAGYRGLRTPLRAGPAAVRRWHANRASPTASKPM